MKRIGERIKKYRRIYNMALGDLATKVGITPSALSQIENAKAFPSIITLKSIAENLHTTVGELIGENEASKHSPVYRAVDYKLLDNLDYKATIYHIPYEDVNKQMDSFVIILKPQEKIENIFASHSGQRMCYVLQGNIEFTIDEKKVELKTGDSAFFHAKNISILQNKQQEDTKLLLVIAPASM
ncbi:MAG: helix-turn-helix transcriptional regulator [Paludibacteraceae bacterium]|nr:helix-turn-helix transcriptional regulator [Paludibacteraceae bacterium]